MFHNGEIHTLPLTHPIGEQLAASVVPREESGVKGFVQEPSAEAMGIEQPTYNILIAQVHCTNTLGHQSP